MIYRMTTIWLAQLEGINYFVHMKLHTINTGHFKLDGGAMFGVVPKSIWNKLNPADENNMCSWAMRCLLIEDGDRLILIDNGIGNKQDDKFMGFYYLHGNATLDGSLKQLGFSRQDITDVVLSHLHFDHCGGSVQWNSDRSGFELCFPNATYWMSEAHFNWAWPSPNPREKASFLKDNILPIYESGHAKLVQPGELVAGLEVLHVYGHTEDMMLPLINYKGKKLLFAADLIPSAGHIPLPYIMAYDMRPLQTLKEKTEILQRAVSEDWVLFLEHDPITECIRLESSEKGIRVADRFALASW